MPNQQNITIKRRAAPLAVTVGNAVKLRAETSVNAGELAEQCFNIEFEVLGLPEARRSTSENKLHRGALENGGRCCPKRLSNRGETHGAGGGRQGYRQG